MAAAAGKAADRPDEPVVGSRFSARWRIVTWIMVLLGIVLFVRLLEWLLEHKHTVTLVAMAGLLLGSLRALWPWQAEDGSMLRVGDDWPMALGLFMLGAFIVGVVAWVQHRFSEPEDVR